MEDVVEKTFEMAFLVEDLREVWRKSAPFHKLSLEDKEKVLVILQSIKKNCDNITEKVAK